jgi:hypothetical protein
MVEGDDDSREFHCPHCGRTVRGLLTDVGYTLPDEVWALSFEVRAKRSSWTTDWCWLDDGRFFIRCILYVPFTDRDGKFGWGLWVSIREDDFRRYLDLYDRDASTEPAFFGTIANEPPGYKGLLGQPVTVQPGTASQRPQLTMAPDNRHLLSREQHSGIDIARQHELLERCGLL